MLCQAIDIVSVNILLELSLFSQYKACLCEVN